MKKAKPAGLLGLLLFASALSCQTKLTHEATAETVRGVGADSPNLPTSNAKFSIQSLESNVVVEAQLNPKELTVEKNVPWQTGKGGKGQTGGDAPSPEFAGSEGRKLSFELMFDLFEEQGNVDKQYVQPLFELTVPLVELERPPRVLFVWGDQGFPAFEGVIESIAAKYTMFSPEGTPVRATVDMTARESSSEPCSTDADCAAGERCRAGLCQWLGK